MPEIDGGKATVESVIKALNAAANPFGFSCKRISWEDAQRTHSFGGLSSHGPNIADVRLYEKSGQLLYTLRSDNWNERLGYVASSDVMLMTGNEKGSSELRTVSLADYLRSSSQFGSYAGLKTPSLFAPGVDEMFTIRFQAVFLPVAAQGGGRARTEFCTEVYNYQTFIPSNPRNLLLLATPQGTSMQEDTPYSQKIFYHSYDAGSRSTRQYWLEAEQSEHTVGGAQVETVAAAQNAVARGKAVAVRIGPSAMGTRFNVQMLIQVPLKQQPQQRPINAIPCFGCAVPSPSPSGTSLTAFGAGICYGGLAPSPNMAGGMANCRVFQSTCAPPSVGVSNAARVSRGTCEGRFMGLPNETPEREPSQHGTITVTLYYTVEGGVPTVADVQRCVRDLDGLYRAMPSDKPLSACAEVTANAGTSPQVRDPSNDFANQLLYCGAGHVLLPFNGYTFGQNVNNVLLWCDVCGSAITPTAAFQPSGCGCRVCDFDLCGRCCARFRAKRSGQCVLVPHHATVGGPRVGAGQVSCTICKTHLFLGGLFFVKPFEQKAPMPHDTIMCLHCFAGGAVAP